MKNFKKSMVFRVSHDFTVESDNSKGDLYDLQLLLLKGWKVKFITPYYNGTGRTDFVEYILEK